MKTFQAALLVAGAWLGVVAYHAQIDNLGTNTTPARAWAIVIGAWLFLVAGVVSLVAFALTWLLREVPLRTQMQPGDAVSPPEDERRSARAAA